ncbi:MAG: hypothetical protein A2275_14250 [Bacteroidetes bacterium RIFOXYA12_FULL_35_11]|nr:MAG: hypothetical protein A2X01_12345 [Bacteroidetes bacterium GWF2_35_48]OFY76473.1 MAG: hypothetical protein A2275_14250 [Bacteroidetes bacterium RIFOXYA12_FULL_35_11]OFZ01964.1 MAG: hypothetical protein A2491_19820 [Bacteroidetes bacterium RIFOXYC12_FULL_35_7]HBX51093.1 hypothetical protein [Bacteroidales bacterium]
MHNHPQQLKTIIKDICFIVNLILNVMKRIVLVFFILCAGFSLSFSQLFLEENETNYTYGAQPSPYNPSGADYVTANPVSVDERSFVLDHGLLGNDKDMSLSAGSYTLMGSKIFVQNIPVSFGMKLNLLKENAEKFFFRIVFPYTRKKQTYTGTDWTTGKTEEVNLVAKGIGDVNLKAFYILKTNEDYACASLGLKLPTGKTENIVWESTATSQKINMPIGTGSTDLGLGFYYLKDIGSLKLSADLNYNLTGKEKSEEKTSFSVTNSEIKYGNSFALAIGAAYPIQLVPDLFAGASLGFGRTGKTNLETKITNTGTPGTVTFNLEMPTLTTFDLIPYVKYNLTAYNAIVALDAYIPLYTKWNETNDFTNIGKSSRKFKIGLRFVWRFDPKESGNVDVNN